MQERYEKLREELTACRQLLALDQAMMAAILEVTGEVTVSREAINRHFREITNLRAEQTDTDFRLWVEDKKEG